MGISTKHLNAEGFGRATRIFFASHSVCGRLCYTCVCSACYTTTTAHLLTFLFLAYACTACRVAHPHLSSAIQHSIEQLVHCSPNTVCL